MARNFDQESPRSHRRDGEGKQSSGWRPARGAEGRRDGGHSGGGRGDHSGHYWSADSRDGERGERSGRGRGGERRSYGDRDRRDGWRGNDDRKGGWRGNDRRDDRRDDRRGQWRDQDDRRDGRKDRSDRRDGWRGNDRRDDRRDGGRGNWRSSDDRRGSWRGNDRREDRKGGWRDQDDRRDARGGNRGPRDDRGGRFNEREDRGSRDFSQRDNARRDFGRRGGRGQDDGYRNLRGGEARRERAKELQYEIPESITADSLPKETYAHLRGLNATNAELVARHLAYAGEMMDIDPEVAYDHAKAAYSRAARIDIVREAVGIAAYVTGRYSEALQELRAYRRLSNDYSHVAIEADAERGLGRSEKALRFISEIPLDRLDPVSKVELAIVTAGAKADLEDHEGALALMEKIIVDNLGEELASRVELVKADQLEALGRADEAQALRAQWEPVYEGGDEDADMLVDLADVLDDEKPSEPEAAADSPLETEDADVPLMEEVQLELGADFDPSEWEGESEPEAGELEQVSLEDEAAESDSEEDADDEE